MIDPTMGRFIVRFSGKGPPADIVAGVRGSPRLRLIDTTPRMLLVEGAEDEVRQAVASDPTARIYPEVTDYAAPDPHPKVR